MLALSPSQSTPLLLELARRQTARRRPADLLAQRERDQFVAPAAVDLRTMHALDGMALAAASDFEALLLSPVAPLGVCSVLAPTSQDRTLTATRSTEVVSDPTNVLAVEAARRLATDSSARLCTVHQVVRAQALPPVPWFSRHFRLFALVEAGRALADDGFEVAAIARHVAIFDRLFDATAALGCVFPGRRATIFSTAATEVLAARVHTELTRVLPHIEVLRERFESSYYAGVRVLFGAESSVAGFVPIGDVGRFDWMRALRSDRRARMVASGLGLQLVPLLFDQRAR